MHAGSNPIMDVDNWFIIFFDLTDPITVEEVIFLMLLDK